MSEVFCWIQLDCFVFRYEAMNISSHVLDDGLGHLPTIGLAAFWSRQNGKSLVSIFHPMFVLAKILIKNLSPRVFSVGCCQKMPHKLRTTTFPLKRQPDTEEPMHSFIWKLQLPGPKSKSYVTAIVPDHYKKKATVQQKKRTRNQLKI